MKGKKDNNMIENPLIKNHDNDKILFLTGAGGTGKTYIINGYREWFLENKSILENKNSEICIATPTGIAATHIEGASTIHSLFKFNMLTTIDTIVKDSIDGNFRSSYRKRLVKNMKVLIIDEISMVSLSLLKMIDKVIKVSLPKRSKNFNKPFGGIKVIFVGDFAQLPPIVKLSINEEQKEEHQWLFQTEEWKSLNIETIFLTENYRQGVDEKALFNILDFVRYNGNTINKDNELVYVNDRQKKLTFLINYFNKKQSKFWNNYNSGKFDDFIILFSKNSQVDELNGRRLDLLKTPLKTFTYKFTHNKKERNSFTKDLPQSVIDMFTNERNINQKLKLKVGARVMATVNSVSQGIRNGMLGTLKQINDDNTLNIEWDNGHKSSGIRSHGFQSLDIKGEVDFTVFQLPIRLAYAITIHKSQGFSFPKVFINASNFWEYNHLYVAMSRAMTMNDLYIEGLSEESFRSNNDVSLFYFNLLKENKKAKEQEKLIKDSRNYKSNIEKEINKKKEVTENDKPRQQKFRI